MSLEHATPPESLRGISFDVTGTLLHCPRLAEIYAGVLSRHGWRVDPDRVAELVPQIWRETDCRVELCADRFSAEPGGAPRFWRRFVERLLEHLDMPGPAPFAAAELFDLFAHAEAWAVYGDVVPALTELRRHGLRLAVISNWDERLPLLLSRLRLDGFFDAVVYSAEVGVEKPHPAIFREAAARLKLNPWQILHVGDRRRLDVEGARAARMEALLLRRSGAPADLSSLAALPARLRPAGVPS